MATTINIIIKGIGICYLKNVQGKDVFRVLFPFNECHSVKFSYETGGRTVFVGHLGKAKSKIEVTATSAASNLASVTEQFRTEVFDLTAGKAELTTHPQIYPKAGLDERGVVLTIPSVSFDVRHTLRYFDVNSPEKMIIYVADSDGAPDQIINDLAHSITGQILLGAGGTVSVKTDEGNIFTSRPDSACTLIFDNDCKEVTHKPDGSYKNDMEMLYELVEEPGHTTRKFFVSGREKNPTPKIEAAGTFLTEPPQLVQGKPCLIVKVSDTDSINRLP